MTRSNSIVLIGMPGAGKSTIGVLLAKEIARDFVDTDLLIQTHVGKTLQDIVNEAGHMHLRELEEATLLQLEGDYHVVATGGSAVYSDAAMQFLRTLGQVVYLALPEEDLLARIDNMSRRGIAKPEGQSFSELYAERVPLCEKYADITINCYAKTPAEIVAEIIYREGGKYAEVDA